MSDERDPTLQELFDIASNVEHDDDFPARVMAKIDAERRQVLAGWAVAGLVLVAVGWFLYEPLQNLVFGLSELLPSQLIELDTEWASQLLAPINSVAALVAVGYFAFRALYKKVFM